MTRRLLLIDDDPDIREVAQLALEKFSGWAIVVAASGPEGLTRAKTETLDAILLDVSMPGMDGFMVFEQLQAEPSTQTIPVILLTAKVLPSDQRRFQAMGVAGVLNKPFDPVTMGLQVAALLQWTN